MTQQKTSTEYEARRNGTGKGIVNDEGKARDLLRDIEKRSGYVMPGALLEIYRRDVTTIYGDWERVWTA
jgi:hypothetical protein